MVYHIDWFVNIEEFLHPWNKTNFIMSIMIIMSMYDLFNMFLDFVY